MGVVRHLPKRRPPNRLIWCVRVSLTVCRSSVKLTGASSHTVPGNVSHEVGTTVPVKLFASSGVRPSQCPSCHSCSLTSHFAVYYVLSRVWSCLACQKLWSLITSIVRFKPMDTQASVALQKLINALVGLEVRASYTSYELRSANFLTANVDNCLPRA